MKLPETDQELLVWALEYAGRDFLQLYREQPQHDPAALAHWVRHQMQHRPNTVRIDHYRSSACQGRTWIRVRVCDILVASAIVTPEQFNACYAEHHAHTDPIRE